MLLLNGKIVETVFPFILLYHIIKIFVKIDMI